MTEVAVRGCGYAEANWGRWIVNCPGAWCDSALQVSRGQATYQCWGCGTEAPIVWPPDPPAIEALLMMRPAAKLRNWLPGETLSQLMMENVSHGFLPPGWTELETSTPLMRTADERVVGGLLVDALPGLPRLPIGA